MGWQTIGKDGFIAGRVANRIANAKFDFKRPNMEFRKGAREKHQLRRS